MNPQRPIAWLASVVLATLLLPALYAQDAKKKVLYVDSYHEGYAWSDSITEGIKRTLRDKYDLKIYRMDTKRQNAEDDKKAAGAKVKALIEEWQPDVVIASDDNAAKYVIVPFFKDSKLPFVFCGLNWDASGYGFPWPNVTGMVEVSLVPQLAENVRKYAKGDRWGFLGKDNETDRKEAEFMAKLYGLKLTEKFVNTFAEWQAAYLEMQNQVDMLLVVNNAGITGWDDAAAKAFVLEKTRIPSGSCHDFVAPFVLLDYAKLGDEQGEWAAAAAIQILEGKLPKDIPVTPNKKGQIILNMPLAKKLGVKFPLELMKTAKFVKE